MLQAMVGQTGIQIIHRHTAPRDTAFWSEFVNVQMYDPKKPKFVHTENELYQTGWSLFETVSYSINNAYADAAGGGHSQSQNTSSGDSYSIEQSRSNTLTDSVNQSVQTGQFHADTHSKSHQDGVTEQRGNHSGLSHDEQRIRDMFNQGSSNVEGKSSVDGTTDGTTDTVSRNETNGGSQSNAAGTTNGFSLTGNRNAGSSFDVSSSWNRTTNRSLNINYAQQWLPKYEWREVLKFIEWFSNEEQQQMIAGDIAREKDGGCHIVISGLGILRVRMPLCGDPFANAPHALYAELRKYVQQVKQLPIYHSTPNILAERKAQIQRTIVEFQKLTNSPSKPAIEDSNSEDSGVFQSETDLQQQFLRDLRHDNGELGI